MSDVADDALDWDEWMDLSDAEREAAVDREMAAYNRWYDGLTLAGQIAHGRRAALRGCRATRRLIRHPLCPEIIRQDARERLKAAQVRLLKIRIWRATGSRPGSA
ncbi:hypothetical protein LNAOJCKE_0892 [Methylorubrum aminovorans]|uniref:Uncharacterized protein n=1 Tax=Methylorubrum aminovorans TaxID=269069 RepID=A0ABQ4U9M9_9HYPH|nr:hypothetical protein [Methylorubrum aminovorans]GJE63694.1 hypothetical protein LNAOJCKE_0892 [Methylorubrum aminovorans]GMA73625.1 hypothetical protein GCM10025880_00420 [Methylorubrum aminovorans]GMA79811.1 hypothetical protein GCM10025880_62280 [Methylorubrum aminovorans]